MFRRLSRSFYSRSTLLVARALLGKHIVRRIGRTTLVGRIVEVEAYLGERDPASHAYRGLTPRNAVMFGKPGTLYVYFTYGMHFCANVVTEPAGAARAVLIRAVEPIVGIRTMEKNRRRGQGSGKRLVRPYALTSGPARLCQAFGIQRAQNGEDLLGGTIFLAHGRRVRSSEIGQSSRIGIRAGLEKKWRFFLKGSPWVSR